MNPDQAPVRIHALDPGGGIRIEDQGCRSSPRPVLSARMPFVQRIWGCPDIVGHGQHVAGSGFPTKLGRPRQGQLPAGQGGPGQAQPGHQSEGAGSVHSAVRSHRRRDRARLRGTRHDRPACSCSTSRPRRPRSTRSDHRPDRVARSATASDASVRDPPPRARSSGSANKVRCSATDRRRAGPVEQLRPRRDRQLLAGEAHARGGDGGSIARGPSTQPPSSRRSSSRSTDLRAEALPACPSASTVARSSGSPGSPASDGTACSRRLRRPGRAPRVRVKVAAAGYPGPRPIAAIGEPALPTSRLTARWRWRHDD